MANSGQSFREFEQAGWEDSRVVAKYHEHLSGVTTQSVDALLDAAGVRNGSRVLHVATGAGYIAAAAALRGAKLMRKRFPSIPTPSMQSLTGLACATFPTLTSRCVRRSGC